MTASRALGRTLRSSGFWTVVLATVHVATTPVFYPASVRSIYQAGVVGSIDADPALSDLRGVGFWYATAGLLLGLVGWGVLRAERRGRGAPPTFAFTMALTGVWGVVMSPLSGFWLFLPIAWLAHRNRAAD